MSNSGATEVRASWSGSGWQVRVEGDRLFFDTEGDTLTVAAGRAGDVSVTRSWFRWQLRLDDQRRHRLKGMKSVAARELAKSIEFLVYVPEIEVACQWHRSMTSLLSGGRNTQRWIAREAVAELLDGRPRGGLLGRLRDDGVENMLESSERDAALLVDADIEQIVEHTNNQILEAELVTQRDFFDRIERSPLTDEQAKAVVCYDNRVQVIAAAGSGKTSVMVARAAYALHRGFTTPDRILLLAFNGAAADELQERIESRLAAAGIDSDGLQASTFHAFGLKMLGRATNSKPSVPDWVKAGNGAPMVQEIVDEIRDGDLIFRYKWDLFRLLFAGTPDTPDGGDPDEYDDDVGTTGFRTFGGEIVKSAGERIIANWLHLNGVTYEYERSYDVDTTDADHSQYHPDFYYPDIDVWHEHWAVGRDGKPPTEFVGYAEGMEWKRRLHRAQGTTLIESTWAGVMFGSDLVDLERQLTGLGLTFDWNPDRELAGVQPIKHETLTRLIRTFMTHVKGNSLSPEELVRRLDGRYGRLAGYRTRLFLDLYWPVHAEWERRLRAGNHVDFDDMLVQAADHFEAGTIDTRYDLVMVDEFQDASRARARLVRGLVGRPGRHLLAVGDDWQSINRFAGSDISVMTGFHDWFGAGKTLRLTATFRCTQVICDAAANFIRKNRSQIPKDMRSMQAAHGLPIEVILAGQSRPALERYLDDLARALDSGAIQPNSDGKVSVLVLGRYNFDSDVVPARLPKHLDVTFRTVHRSKGLEADYVVLPKMTTRRSFGFPSTITDDAVLDLAMVSGDEYPYAEERRLFYVALTRARRQVTLIAERRRESPFALELMLDGHAVATFDGDSTEVRVCDKCERATMVLRSGPYGDFYGCGRFPLCKNTQKVTALA